MKRIVEISSKGMHVAAVQGSLAIKAKGDLVASVPFKDLGTLILANSAITITSSALAQVVAAGGQVVVAGFDFQPVGCLLPLRANTLRTERVRAQVGAGQPLRKRIWQSLVERKILNQAALIEDRHGRKRLHHLAESVRSGDRGNCEAQAAQVYWPLVFSESHPAFSNTPFRRRREGTWPNNFLNFGYAILRSSTARALCASGLLPELGVHHHNRYDPFPLASDVMEPYRPWIDDQCRALLSDGPGNIDRNVKAALLGIDASPVQLPTGITPLQVAVQQTAASLARAFKAGLDGAKTKQCVELLVLPSFPSQDES
jgi:CRISP-associated protein Cas1